MNGQFDIGEITPKRYFTITAIVIGLLFGLAESQTSSFTGFLKGLIQWQLQVAIPMLFLIFMHIGLNKVSSFAALNPWLKLFISGLLAAVAFVPISLLIDIYLTKEEFSSENLFQELLIEFGHMAPPVIITWLVINAPWLMGYKLVRNPIQSAELNQAHDTNAPNPKTANEPAVHPDMKSTHTTFLDLLPEAIQSKVIYLKAELHYLKVVTTTGKALILYNLKDAINDLAGQDGIQTHRSYWVGTQFIDQLKKTGRQGVLLLKNGAEIPVSRTNLEKLKQFLISK